MTNSTDLFKSLIELVCVSLSLSPITGNGDILSFEDYYTHRKETDVAGVMIARSAVDL